MLLLYNSSVNIKLILSNLHFRQNKMPVTLCFCFPKENSFKQSQSIINCCVSLSISGDLFVNESVFLTKSFEQMIQ